MIIVVNDQNEIVQLIRVGSVSPDVKSYEINEIPQDILNSIGDYKYIDGQFIRRENADTEHVSEAKAAKIQFLSSTCHQLIENGVDFNGAHYSLKSTDQMNLSKLASVAMMTPQVPIFYHADGNLCRQYTPEEIVQLSQLAVAWISYHTTYFNFAKAYIESLSDFSEIALFKYGMSLSGELQTQMNTIISQFGITFDQIIDDPTNYYLIQHPNTLSFGIPTPDGVHPV